MRCDVYEKEKEKRKKKKKKNTGLKDDTKFFSRATHRTVINPIRKDMKGKY